MKNLNIRRRVLLTPVAFFTLILVFCSGNTIPARAQVFEGFWEQKALVTSQLPVWGKKVEKEDHRIFVTANFLKTVDLNDGRTNIFDYRKKILYRLDPAQKTVAKISFSEFEKIMKRDWQSIRRANNRFREKLKSMTLQQRQMAIQFLGGDPTKSLSLHPKIELKELPDSKIIAGFHCTHRQILADGIPFFDAYWTNAIQLPRAPVQIFRQFGYFPFELPPEVRNLTGFPMKTTIDIRLGVARVLSTATVTRVVRKKIPAAEFQTPKDFRSVPWNYMKLF